MLSIKNLTKIYKTKGGEDTKALDNVSLDFPEKGMIFLLGKSGSGKSTLLNLIGGLDFPTSGEIILKGRSSKDFSQSDFDSYRNTYVGFVFQEYNILNEFNVEQNIALAIELQNKKVKKEDVDHLLKEVDLENFAKRKPNTLSGGQKQRIAIARALIKAPNIIMADEPTGALDSKTGEQVFETLKKLSSDKLVIVVSHDRDFAERFGDRIIELKDGKVLSDETKEYKQPERISDNVAIINTHAIKIEDAKKLTKADFEKLYDAIKQGDGKVFISSGDNASKSMKIARIQEDGTSDEFAKTKEVKVKEYDASKTKFIKSRMPLGKSIKMGLSSLKTKPVRLVFTILLSVISFSLFGVAAGLMLYNDSHTYSETLKKTDYLAEPLQKISKGKQVYQEISDGKVVRENKYDSTREELFGINEVKQLNENSHGLVYVGVGGSNNYGSSNFPFMGLGMKKNAKYYSTYYGISYYSDAGEEMVKKLGYQIEGNYPTNEDEILLPKIFGEMLIDSEATTKKSINELIGEEFNFSFGNSTKPIILSGFYDAGAIPEKYKQLASEESSLSSKEKDDLSNDFYAFMGDSFNSVAFVTSDLYDKVVQKNSSSVYIPLYYRNGIRLSEYEIKEDITPDFGQAFYTETTYNTNKAYIKLYDRDGNPVTDISSLGDKQAYVGESMFFGNSQSVVTNFYQSFLNSYNNSNFSKFMPIYTIYAQSASDQIQELITNIGAPESLEQAAMIFEQFGDEFEVAYKIEEFFGEFRNSSSYSTLPETDRTKIDEIYNSDYNETSDVEFLYNIMVEHFDEFVPNYFPYHYLNLAYSYRDSQYQEIFDNNPDMVALAEMSREDWTSQDVAKATTFLEDNFSRSLSPYSSEWYSRLAGYTFVSYKVPADSVFNPVGISKLHYKNYNGETGKIDVVGYFTVDAESYGGDMILMKQSYIDSITLESKGGGSQSIYFYETNYVAPEDARYTRAMVQTNYSFGEVEFMRKSNDKTFTYNLTSPAYQKANFVVAMIIILKNVFLWVGVGFGVFAALMLLNFISVSISTKKRDIGILRAIGARKIDVFKIFFSESLFIAAICSILAISITIVTDMSLDNYFISEIGLSILQFNIITFLLIIGIALVISFIATLLPVLHSSRKPPVESIRSL
ncbi:MAG: ATP-binding cassette domain-containing protein [Bacilli bacterium]|nr:ATP-binding cassette domain-containing protein [Bacilli bacterium]